MVYYKTKTTMFASTAIVAVFLGLLNLGMLNSILEHFSILSTYILNLNSIGADQEVCYNTDS